MWTNRVQGLSGGAFRTMPGKVLSIEFNGGASGWGWKPGTKGEGKERASRPFVPRLYLKNLIEVVFRR